MPDLAKLQELCHQVATRTYSPAPHAMNLYQYVATGNRTLLDGRSPTVDYEYWQAEALALLPMPSRWNDQDRRLARGIARISATNERHDFFFQCIEDSVAAEQPGDDTYGIWRAEARAAGLADAECDRRTLQNVSSLLNQGIPTSAGQHMLSLADEQLGEALDSVEPDYLYHYIPTLPLTKLLAEAAPTRLPTLAERLLAGGRNVIEATSKRERGERPNPRVAEEMIKANASLARAVDAATEPANVAHRYLLLKVLASHDPAAYGQRMLDAAKDALHRRVEEADHPEVAQALIATLGDAAAEPIADYFRGSPDVHLASRVIAVTTDLSHPAAAKVVAKALDAADRWFEHEAKVSKGQPVCYGYYSSTRLRLKALEALVRVAGVVNPGVVETRFHEALERTVADELPKLIGILGRWDAGRATPLLWPVLGHKSKVARRATARALASADEAEVMRRAKQMLSQKKADTRETAVMLLSAHASAAMLELLEAHLDVEAKEDVRDAALLGLADAWRKQGRTLTKADVGKRIKKADAAGKLAEPPAAWLDLAKLPTLSWTDGKPLTDREKAYLLHRQSRGKTMAADVEAEPMYALIDRSTSGDFAVAVLAGYLATKHDPKEKWALALAGLLGGDAVVPTLSKQIDAWVKANRGALAEHAVRALALVGSDVALQAVDAFALKYRSKMKNVGRAAVEAFDAAAEAAGVTPEELGDRVVPYLGFPAEGSPRVLNCGTTTIEASIGPDLKLRFRNVEKNKLVKTLPAACGAEAKKEFKEVAANLRDVVKNQTTRLENLLVRQRRWPPERWEQLFLKHPILRPFAWKLVWGTFDGSTLAMTFRPLEDGTLTDNDDEPVELPTAGEIGMVHPLEIDEETRRAWLEHLADYEISPPFRQLDREIVAPDESTAAKKQYDGVDGTTLGALTFRNRAEKRGWRRGSVNDGGGVWHYVKTFPASGVDVFLGLDDFFIGVGPDDQVGLGKALFVKADSVKTGSYTYDEPKNDDDPRLVPLGDVPPIAYSEAVADLHFIAGKAADEEEA
jgi:hypothetical protein